MPEPATTLLDLACSRCGAPHPSDRLQGRCRRCQGLLLARYDLAAAADAWQRGRALRRRPQGLWRYAELLPVRDPRHRLTLGEGGTPLLEAPRLGARLGLRSLFLKDEGRNPTGSFKARGLCVAVSRARELGVRAVAIPTAGNAGAAMAAYAARGGLRATVYMPADTPAEFVAECRHLGARVVRVPGVITDAAAAMAAEVGGTGVLSMATFQEPYRVEGKKTMGFEVAEQLGWQLPDIIVYPTGGGTGLVGIWKAFEELEALGCVGPQRPRMVAVQASGCAPIVRAFEAGAEAAEPWPEATTLASGLRVPTALADREILQVLRRSGGHAVAVTDAEMVAALRELAAAEGIYAAPEAAATVAALGRLRAAGALAADETVVAFLTGSAYKYQSVLPAGDGCPGDGGLRGSGP